MSVEGLEKQTVHIAVQPGTRLWFCVWTGTGLALFFGAGLLVLGEVFLTMKAPVLEALLTMRP